MDTETKQPTRTLVKKLAAIMGEVERVAKNGRNSSQGYDYATEADIAAAVRSGMAARSVILIPSVLETTWGSIQTQKGGTLTLCTLKVKFTLEDGESGETREYIIMGQGTDNGDKGTYKAMTGAEKYALMKLFLIPTGDDPERDETEGQPAPRPRPQPKAAPPSPAPEPAQPPAPKQAPALRARAVQVWKKASGTGMSADEFGQWVTLVLGRTAASTDWTMDDVSHLENALLELLSARTEAGSHG